MKYCCMKIEKVSAVKEAAENFVSDFDDNELYHIDNTGLEDTKANLNDVSVLLNTNLKYICDLK